MFKHTHSKQRGFTLVELLIVVIILAILAAIVVPQFASSTDDAKLSALDSTLAGMRSAIDLYYQQHGTYPGKNTAVPAADCAGGGGTAGAGAADSEAAFLTQLRYYTNTAGQACSVKTGTYTLGPYYKKDKLPKDPIVGVKDTTIVNTTGDLAMIATDDTGGWKFDNVAGKFIINHTGYDDR